jgi:hypothetical protein
MTDNRIEKIRAEIERRIEDIKAMDFYDQLDSHRKEIVDILNELLSFIDSIQKDSVNKERFFFKALLRLLEMIEPTERAEYYIAKLAYSLGKEGYATDAKLVRETIKIMNGEKVGLAVMDEKPVSEDAPFEPIGIPADAVELANIPNKKEPTIPDIVDEHWWEMLGEEPVSEDLEKFIQFIADELPQGITVTPHGDFDLTTIKQLIKDAAKIGANWQKENLWKSADGDDLPEIDREVIALLDNGKVVFAHRPPEFWDGKNIITGKVTRNYPKTYDKGGWNIPDVKYWLDVKLPKEIEL